MFRSRLKGEINELIISKFVLSIPLQHVGGQTLGRFGAPFIGNCSRRIVNESIINR